MWCHMPIVRDVTKKPCWIFDPFPAKQAADFSVTVSGGIPQIWGFRRQIGEGIWVIGDSPTRPNSSPNLGYFDENWGKKLELNPLLHVKFGQHFVVYSQWGESKTLAAAAVQCSIDWLVARAQIVSHQKLNWNQENIVLYSINLDIFSYSNWVFDD